MGIPGYAQDNKYSIFIYSFWMTDGPKDTVEVFSNPGTHFYFGSDSPFGTTK